MHQLNPALQKLSKRLTRANPTSRIVPVFLVCTELLPLTVVVANYSELDHAGHQLISRSRTPSTSHTTRHAPVSLYASTLTALSKRKAHNPHSIPQSKSPHADSTHTQLSSHTSSRTHNTHWVISIPRDIPNQIASLSKGEPAPKLSSLQSLSEHR
jgi:hypothetical protein